MAEDCPLKVAQLVARVEAELVAEDAPGLAVALERLGLPAGSVEREHRQAPDPLPKRVLLDKRP